MPDGMQVDPKVIEQITQEVKGLGDNWKSLSASLQTDVASVRKLVEDHKGAIGPETKAQIDALSLLIQEKQDKLEKGADDRFSKIEKQLNRTGMGGQGGDPVAEARERADAIGFHKMTMASRGQLRAGVPFREEDVDFDGIKAWSHSFGTYLRSKDDRAIEAKALNTGSDPDGGYWVPPTISNRIINLVFETSPIRQLATVETISTDALEMPNDYGEFSYGWVGEQEARPETTTSQTGVQRIVVHEMYAQPKATQKLLEDASIDVEGWMARKVSDKFGRVEATAFVNGTGVKQPRGLLTYPAGTTIPGTVETTTSGNASLLTSDGLIKCMIALKEPYQAGSVWLMRRATTGSVMLLKDGDGQYIWRAGLEAGRPSVLLGYPVHWAADMPAVASNALALIFGNIREAYTIVDRLGITTLRDPFTSKPFVLFYTRRRLGGDVVNFEAFKILQVAP